MAEILGARPGKLSVGDALFVAGSKIITERILAPFIGNGTVVSGGIKLVGAGLVRGFGGNIGSIISTGMTVDGAEDIVTAFFGGTGNGLLPNLLGGAQSRNVQVI